MQHVSSYHRNQFEFTCLNDLIEEDNPVRFIEAFVEKLDLIQLGFIIKELKKEGRPSYDAKVFLKIYFYGYLNGVRSSRRLEKECKD